jgi:hypothetical protein
MPRGRTSTVRYYFDAVTGSVIAVARGSVRVLQEIMPGIGTSPGRRSKRRGRPPGSKNKKTLAATATGAGQATTPSKRRRGRPKKAT